ncbi:MAG: hypothetical protein WBB67_03025 [bacterium]
MKSLSADWSSQLSESYPGYAGYIHKLLQSDLKITVKQAGCIIDTLKNMIELEEAKDSNGNENNSKEIAMNPCPDIGV